jgi:hypothetical protein
MAKNKKKHKHSLQEAQKAQSTMRKMGLPVDTAPINSNNKTVPASGTIKNTFVLPIAEIKKDLVKTSLFAGFSVVVLVVLYFTQFGYSQLTTLLNF